MKKCQPKSEEHSSGCTVSVKSPLARQEIEELCVTGVGLFFFFDCITNLDHISASLTKHCCRPVTQNASQVYCT